MNNSGQPGTYTNITAAITAASSGDNIYISPYGFYTEDLTIDKDLSLFSAVSGTVFNVIGNLTINGIPNMLVKIIGASFSGNFIANTGAASLNAKCDLYITGCEFRSITSYDFIQMHILFCDFASMIGMINLRHGEIIGNTNMPRIRVLDGPNAGVGDTVFIVGNHFAENAHLSWENDDNYFFISNNYIYDPAGSCMLVYKHHYNSIVNNMILNNCFSTENTSTSYAAAFKSESTSNLSNILVCNNVLEHRTTNSSYAYATNVSNGSGSIPFYYNYTKGGFRNGHVNSVVGNDNLANNADNLSISNDGICNDSTYCVNKGLPSLEYYDIDLTPNDRGAYGGPYSIDNYHNTAAGKARVYDLDMPFEIWNGQTPQVKAKAVHTK